MSRPRCGKCAQDMVLKHCYTVTKTGIVGDMELELGNQDPACSPGKMYDGSLHEGTCLTHDPSLEGEPNPLIG